MTKGHVIPQSVGGKLFAANECKRCNELFGHGPEAALVGDPPSGLLPRWSLMKSLT